MLKARDCPFWEPKENPDPYDYHPQRKNCGTCRHYVWEGFGRCKLEKLLLGTK